MSIERWRHLPISKGLVIAIAVVWPIVAARAFAPEPYEYSYDIESVDDKVSELVERVEQIEASVDRLGDDQVSPFSGTASRIRDVEISVAELQADLSEIRTELIFRRLR